MQLSRKASDRKEMMQIRTNESKTRLAAMKGPSGPAIEGWLAKCGFNSAKYLPRYFQLVNNILLYHATRLKGSIKLERASMTSISYDEKSQMFKFTLNTGRKKLTLGDPHKKNCQKWISKISLVSQSTLVCARARPKAASDAPDFFFIGVTAGYQGNDFTPRFADRVAGASAEFHNGTPPIPE